MELSYRSIATNLNVALGTVYHINHLFIETGDVIPRKAPQRTELRTLTHSDELFILGVITDHPSSYLKELCSAIEDVCGKMFLHQQCVKLSTGMDLPVKNCSM